MNAETRHRFGVALARISDGVAGLEALSADEAAATCARGSARPLWRAWRHCSKRSCPSPRCD